MKNVEVSFVDLKGISTTTNLIFSQRKLLTTVYSVDEVIYFWVISNGRGLMKKLLYRNLETYADRGKCALLKFYEGYHVGGNYSVLQHERFFYIYF